MLTQKEINSRFDEKFNTANSFIIFKHLIGEEEIYGANAVGFIKDFISQIRQADREAIVEMVKNKMMYEIGEGARIHPNGKVYNQALTDILSELTKPLE